METPTLDFVSTRYEISEPVRAKFAELVQRRSRTEPKSIERYLTRSVPRPPDTATFYHLARTLKRRGVDHMWIRSCWIASNTQAFFIGDGDEIIEVVTFRGLRQIRKLWEHTLKESYGGGTPKDNYIEAYKSWAKRTGGGLLNQNSGPRSRW